MYIRVSFINSFLFWINWLIISGLSLQNGTGPTRIKPNKYRHLQRKCKCFFYVSKSHKFAIFCQIWVPPECLENQKTLIFHFRRGKKLISIRKKTNNKLWKMMSMQDLKKGMCKKHLINPKLTLFFQTLKSQLFWRRTLLRQETN